MKEQLLLSTFALGCIPLAAQRQRMQGVKGAAMWLNITQKNKMVRYYQSI